MLFVISIENFKKLKCHTFLEKNISVICSKCDNKDKNRFEEEESIEILKILDLIENI